MKKEESWKMEVDEIVRKGFEEKWSLGKAFPNSWGPFLREIETVEYIAAKANYIASKKELLGKGCYVSYAALNTLVDKKKMVHVLFSNIENEIVGYYIPKLSWQKRAPKPYPYNEPITPDDFPDRTPAPTKFNEKLFYKE